MKEKVYEFTYPCYKVVDSKGNLSKNFAFGGIEKQKEKLEKEGIVVRKLKIACQKINFLKKAQKNVKV